MTSLKDKLVEDAKEERLSPDEMVEAAVATKEDKTSQLGHVMVTLEGTGATSDRRALPEALHVIKEAIIARDPLMFMEPIEESEARVVGMHKALNVAMTIGMHPKAAKKLNRAVFETVVYAFRRAPTGDPAAGVELLKIALKRDESLERLTGKYFVRA